MVKPYVYATVYIMLCAVTVDKIKICTIKYILLQHTMCVLE